MYEVVESRAYVHPDKDYKVSIFGAHPGEGWEVKTTGFTVRNMDNGTYGIGKVPWKTRQEAQTWVDKENQRLGNQQ